MNELDTAAVNAKPPSSRAVRVKALSGGTETEAHAAHPPPEGGAAAAKEVVRSLVVAEKNYQLYPVQGKVVQQSLQSLHAALAAFRKWNGDAFELHVTQFDLLFEGESVYHEEARGKSLAYRLYKDSIRKVAFQEEVSIQQLADFLGCFKESRRSEDSDEDFGTLFWEKDCAHIQITSAESFNTEEVLRYLPLSKDTRKELAPEMFQLDAEDERRLRKIIEGRLSRHEEGERTFELTAAETQQMEALTREEETCSPLGDFVDLLLDLTVEDGKDAKGLESALALIRGIIFSLIEGFEFAKAKGIITRLGYAKHQGLSDSLRHGLRDMLRGLCEKATMQVISAFLKESPQLPQGHDVFDLMKSLGSDALPHYCELFSVHQHAPAIADVLVQLGAGCGDIFSQYLLSPDTQLVRTMIQVILKTDKQGAAQRIATVLKHPDESLRLHAAKTLLEGGDEKAAPVFAHILKQGTRQFLPFSIHFFSRAPCLDIYDDMEQLIRSRQFYDFDGQRQDQCFQGLILSNPSRAIDFIAGSVLRWSFWSGKRATRKKTAALRCLALHPDERAVALLKLFARKKRSPLGAVAARALDIIERTGAATPLALLELGHV